MDASTIAAVSTPVGPGGIGIVRLSGNNAETIASTLFRKAGRRQIEPDAGPAGIGAAFLSHRIYYGHIVDPGQNTVVDEVLLLCMRSPRSYTREDVVEIHSHSGPAVLRRILELTLNCGARLAEPGEFTRRAFLNGRIDLSQAEAVIDVINARTGSALEAANRQLQGALREAIEAWRRVLVDVIARIEAETEFGEETGAQAVPADIERVLQQQLLAPLEQMLRDYENGHFVRDGLRIVVIGRPNVGKSSLMNRLLKKERAIVTALPGTTRDSIEESLSIQGIPVVITDTAGLHATDEPVEVLGIRKTHEYIDRADLILFMIAADEGVQGEDEAIYKEIALKDVIVVVNKTDLMPAGSRTVMPEALNGRVTVEISAKYDIGIDTLKTSIVQYVLKDQTLVIPDRTIPNLRHKIVFEKCRNEIMEGARELRSGVAVELVGERLKGVYDDLGVVIGENAGDAILDQIFSNFCIGK